MLQINIFIDSSLNYLNDIQSNNKCLFMKYLSFLLCAALLLATSSCIKKDDDTIDEPENGEIYFPSTTSSTWETVSVEDLSWNKNAEQPLYDLLDEKDTKAFMILKNGKIVIEKYFDDFTQNSQWYWASAAKTLTAFTVGIAQENELLDIDDKTSDYLGEGWTSATLEQENLITVKNQLTMTSGLNGLYFDCVTPDCLKYLADAGTRWAYTNGPYTLLQTVVANASGISFSNFYNTNLRDKIGMDGIWQASGNNNIYYSTARSMARFGILNLNNGKWDDEIILGDNNYLQQMKNTSQDLNKSYGYLWWLNGKESFRVPASQTNFNGKLIPNAPNDTYAGLGKNDQKLYIVPSKGLVIVRMGEDAGEDQAGPSSFDNDLWEKINALID